MFSPSQPALPFFTLVKHAACAAGLLAALASAAPAGDITAGPKDAEARASQELHLATAVAEASRAWRAAFNAGDAAAAAALYEEDAIMVAKPFGTFEGRAAIETFWQGIIDAGFDDVVYFNTKTEVVDQSLSAARVSASWTMNNAKGIITNEHWVLQSDGTARLREDHFEVQQ